MGGLSMLTRDQLAELYRGLEQEKVLTVYVDGAGKDPAQRRVWRLRLIQELEREEHRLQREDSDELSDFRAAEERVLRELDGYQASLPLKGWVGFATAEGLRHSENLPVQVPNLVRWEYGPRVAPYIRGLKQLRPMAIALVDGRRSRIFLYREGEVEEVEDFRADTFLGDLLDLSAPQRTGRFSGARGETATDAAQRYLEDGTIRMLRRVRDVCMEITKPDGFLLVGGDQEALAAFRPMLPKHLDRRTLENSSLIVEMSLPEVKAAAAEGASTLSKLRQITLLDQITEQAYSGGNGCLGAEDTVLALREGRVDILALSRGFVEANPDLADLCVSDAFHQGADVRVFSGEPGSLLDAEGGGIGARLRYRW
ncbi:MAG: baeRF10 domain-containing protein, partial [Longimicrobiales bacterium]